jgi:hypothetical protein
MSLDELRGLLERHARANLSTAIEGVRICKADHAVAPESSMSGTVLAVVAQGRKRLAVGDSVHEYSAGQYLVASVDLPVTGHSTDAAPDHPTLGFGMTLEPAVIAELLLQTGPGDLPRSPGSARPGITVSDAGSTGASSALHPALTQIVCEAAIPPLRRCGAAVTVLKQRGLCTHPRVSCWPGARGVVLMEI